MNKAGSKQSKDGKLKSALRDNLKKRKQQTRKLNETRDAGETFSVKLRNRDVSVKKPD
ncbi:MAG: hypothetical protein AAGA76_04025 [Pseudomonadota bacterium]